MHNNIAFNHQQDLDLNDLEQVWVEIMLPKANLFYLALVIDRQVVLPSLKNAKRLYFWRLVVGLDGRWDVATYRGAREKKTQI